MPGWRFAADYRPGQRGAEVGGDFYDVFPVEDGHVVVLGDVTGKGVRAAALTSLVRYTARTAAAFDPRPSAVLAQVNRALRQRPRLAPVTMVCGAAARRASSRSRSAGTRSRCSSAPAAVREARRDRACCSAPCDDYEARTDVTVPLAPGDTLLLYTDGVTDRPAPTTASASRAPARHRRRRAGRAGGADRLGLPRPRRVRPRDDDSTTARCSSLHRT